jgi:hypothetical protein
MLLLQGSRTLVSFVLPVLQPGVLLNTFVDGIREGGLRARADGEFLAQQNVTRKDMTPCWITDLYFCAGSSSEYRVLPP